MERNALIYGIIGALIGGAIVWFYIATVINSNNVSVGMMGIRQNMQRGSTMDAHFIEQMIPHHQDAITMAEIALERSDRTEIKQLAQNIITSQSKEIEQMRKWYKDWYGKNVPQNEQVMGKPGMGMRMGMMGNSSDLERLKNTSEFDKTFIEEMIPHHQMAVMMAQMLKNGTQRPEMNQLADNIITAQTKEIDQMRKWYIDWGY